MGDGLKRAAAAARATQKPAKGPDPALPTPADPPEWAMREAQKILLYSYPAIPARNIARALVTVRRETLGEAAALLNELHVPNSGRIAWGVIANAINEILALIDKDPTPAALPARDEEETP